MRGTSNILAVTLVWAVVILCSCTESSQSNTRSQLRFMYNPDILPVVSPAELPFPSDLYRSQGQLHFAPAPTAKYFEAEILLPALASLDGFGTQQSIYFGFAAQGTAAPMIPDEVYLLGIQADAPDYLQPQPIDVRLDARLNLLVVTPALGHPLQPDTRYMAVVLSSDTVAAAPSFARVRDGNPSGASEAAAADGLRDALALAAASLQVSVANIVAATVFTTQDPVRDLHHMMQQAYAADTPDPVFRSRLYADGISGALPLDSLFGTPRGSSGGSDNPGGVLHDNIRAVLLGEVTLRKWSRFLERTPLQRGSDGFPMFAEQEQAEFVLVLPDCPEPASGYPVVIAQHGLNDHKRFPLVLANEIAAQCMATIGIDAVGHGFRARIRRDRINNLTDAPEPDGIADGFAVGGLDQAFMIDPLVARTNLIETAAGLAQLADQLQRADWHIPVPELAGTVLDSQRIGYVGQSMGAIVGSIFAGVARGVNAVVINVGGGNYTRIFQDSPGFGIGLPVVGAIAESDPSIAVNAYHPGLALFQAVLEAADPINYARHWSRAPLFDTAPKHVLLQSAALDQLIPNSTSAGLATAAGYPLLGDAQPRTDLFAVTDAVSLPAGYTTTLPDGDQIAAGLVIFPQAEHGFVLTRCAPISLRYEPPYGPSPDPYTNANPVLGAQRQMAVFLRTALAGNPEILPATAGDATGPGCD